MLTSGSFVGRQREMGELTAALEDAMSGHGRLVMLAGEPGIGKSRRQPGVVGQVPRGARHSSLLALDPSHPSLCPRAGR